MDSKQEEKWSDSDIRWKRRRRVVYATLLFCAVSVGYLIFQGEDTELNQTIANGLIFLAASTVGSYVFGATWDDKKPNK